MSLLSVRDLRIAFHTRDGTVQAVDGIDFDVERGRTLGIVGESGSGKSVICLGLMGLLPCPPARIEGGSARFEGTELLRAPERVLRSLRGRRISMIFQDPLSSLNPYLTIGAQVMEPLRLHLGLGRAAARARAIAALDEVGIREAARRCDDFPHEFSGGMRQRVMIAMALATEPDLLIADEPTTALDVTIQAQILDLIRRLQAKRNIGVIFITHNLGVVAGIADEVLVMHRGRCVERGAVGDIFHRPVQQYTRDLLDSIPASAKPTPPPPPETPVLLRVHGLRVRYDPAPALFSSVPPASADAISGVDIEVRRGEILGLVGESGSGKSTLARAIVRLVEPAAGEVRLDDVAVSALSQEQLRAVRPRMQMIFQDPYSSLDPRMTIHDCLGLALRQGGVVPAERRAAGIAQLLRDVGLDPAQSRRYPHEFSGGQRQRIAIARALALNPDLLIADEPVSSLDVTVQAEILRLLLGINRERGLAMVFISHDLSVIRHVADRTAVMHRGRIVEIGDTEPLFHAPAHPYTRALLSAVPIPDPARERGRPRIAWTADGTYPAGEAPP